MGATDFVVLAHDEENAMKLAKGIVIRLVDHKARINLPQSFANAAVILEQVSDTEIRIRKAGAIPANQLPLYCRESADPALLSQRDWELLQQLKDNPPEPNQVLRRAAARYHSQTGRTRSPSQFQSACSDVPPRDITRSPVEPWRNFIHSFHATGPNDLQKAIG
jgi:hypothetical protein